MVPLPNYQETFWFSSKNGPSTDISSASWARSVAHLSMKSAQNIMGTKRTRSDTQDLWRRWREGPTDPSAGEGSRGWERLPSTKLE